MSDLVSTQQMQEVLVSLMGGGFAAMITWLLMDD